MDADDWQQAAAAASAEMRTELDSLRAKYYPPADGASFRDFWTRIRALNEHVRTAPAITQNDKLEILTGIRELTASVRQTHRELQERSSALKDDLFGRLELVRDTLGSGASIEEIESVRADLANLRTRIVNESTILRRVDRDALWKTWQDINNQAWTALNAHWTSNEEAMSEILGRAEARLEASDSRGAKIAIQEFHSASRAAQVSHRSLRNLRARAASLWTRADELSKTKHEAYIAYLERRLSSWQSAIGRLQRQEAALVRQIELVRQQAERAATDVAAALGRGQVAEHLKELGRIQTDRSRLQTQVENAERVLRKERVDAPQPAREEETAQSPG